MPAGGEAITPDGLEALKAELEELQTTARQAMSDRILAARELGDLKENAEYHIAKDDQAHLETKIKRLRERLRNAVVVEADAGDSTFAFGRTAEVLDEESGNVQVWTIVGADSRRTSRRAKLLGGVARRRGAARPRGPATWSRWRPRAGRGSTAS